MPEDTGASQTPPDTNVDAPLDTSEQALLLQLARDAVTSWICEARPLDIGAYPLTARLRQPRGAFVTLRAWGDLRGCIGYTRHQRPLAETVRDNAVHAAARDPRFEPVKPAELSGIRIEISVLGDGDEPGTPFRRVNDLYDIEIGRDGLYLETPEGHTGLLLPQVAIEQGWDRAMFLAGLCRKTGVDEIAWKRAGVRLYRFTAQVFAET